MKPATRKITPRKIAGTNTRPHATGPTTPHGKAIAARNSTTHGLFARDIVLPSLGEDPQGYQTLEAEWIKQLQPRNLLEHHYVEKIAAASWRLRRLHRWQAQLFEDDTLTEAERLDHLDKVMRHETALHRQIDTAVKMLNKDVPQLYKSRVRDQVLEEACVSERECRESVREETEIELETRGRLRRMRKATEQALTELADAPLDTAEAECENEPDAGKPAADVSPTNAGRKCENELPRAPLQELPLTGEQWMLQPGNFFGPVPDPPTRQIV